MATKRELKELSEEVFYDNESGGIEPKGQREFNSQLIDSFTLQEETDKIEGVLNTETEARKSGDDALSTRIDKINTDISKDIEELKEDIDSVNKDLNTETEARKSAVDDLNIKIDEFNTGTSGDIKGIKDRLESFEGDLKSESEARENADAGLSDRINTLAADTDSKFSEVNSTIEEGLADVESNLNERIDSVEERANTNQAGIEELQTNLANANTSIDSIGNRLIQAETEINNISETVTDHQTRLTDAEENITILESDVAGIIETITNESKFQGYFETNQEIQELTGQTGYYAWSAESGTVWIYNVDSGLWEATGKAIPNNAPVASDLTPLVNGDADSGQSEEYSRADHRHPTDTTRASKSEVDTQFEEVDEKINPIKEITDNLDVVNPNLADGTYNPTIAIGRNINNQTTTLCYSNNNQRLCDIIPDITFLSVSFDWQFTGRDTITDENAKIVFILEGENNAGVKVYPSLNSNFLTETTDTSGTYKNTYQIRNSTSNYNDIYYCYRAYCRFNYIPNTVTLKISNIKLEYGRKNTRWCMSIPDVSALQSMVPVQSNGNLSEIGNSMSFSFDTITITATKQSSTEIKVTATSTESKTVTITSQRTGSSTTDASVFSGTIGGTPVEINTITLYHIINSKVHTPTNDYRIEADANSDFSSVWVYVTKLK